MHCKAALVLFECNEDDQGHLLKDATNVLSLHMLGADDWILTSLSTFVSLEPQYARQTFSVAAKLMDKSITVQKNTLARQASTVLYSPLYPLAPREFAHSRLRSTAEGALLSTIHSVHKHTSCQDCMLGMLSKFEHKLDMVFNIDVLRVLLDL
jgi:hypothetical protein